ncbi:unnamed protein product [Schistocephalus solidus]|uniref:Craniofacial development protein 1 n=1 Tax=Schistocephalus solidus TaxID=70667 RepID=A0A183TKZ7_SCHSO|nr:unnamed protein product [Schistocephalus solidus]
MGDSDHSLDTSDEEYVPPVDVEDSSDDKAESSETSAAPSLAASPTPLNGIAPKRALASNDRLSDALKRLKSTALLPGAAPKLSTLEKSKRDWESFTQEEDIADELKLYNKGKYGYVARKAFESRASERQYAIVRELRLKGSQKR